jgi:hypothetical protein
VCADITQRPALSRGRRCRFGSEASERGYLARAPSLELTLSYCSLNPARVDVEGLGSEQWAGLWRSWLRSSLVRIVTNKATKTAKTALGGVGVPNSGSVRAAAFARLQPVCPQQGSPDFVQDATYPEPRVHS